MESPKKEYNQNLTKTAFRKDAYPYFLNKYIKDPRTPGFFLTDTNEREQVHKQKLWLPGRIYTFQYDPLYKDYLDYYDTRPIVFVHGVVKAKNGNDILVGINLNFLPEQVRVTVLEYFYQQFKTDYAKSNEINGKVTIIQRAIQFIKNWLGIQKIFDDQAKVGYQFAFRNYIISPSRMKGVTLVENGDWAYIPFLQTRDIVGKGLGEIYADYIAHLNENLKKKKISSRKNDELTKRYKSVG